MPADLSLGVNNNRSADITNVCTSILSTLYRYRWVIGSGLYGITCDIINHSFPLRSAICGIALLALRFFPACLLVHFPPTIALSGAYLRDNVTGNSQLLIDLVRSGMDVDCAMFNGETPLHIAARTNNTEAARQLISAGAKIVPNKSGISPFFCAADNIQMIRILTGTEQNPAFDSCKNIYDFFEKVFPSSPYCLPENWKIIASQVHKSPSLNILETEETQLQTCADIPLVFAWNIFGGTSTEATQEIFDESMDVPSIIDILSQNSPIFAKAWKLANQPEKLQIQECSDESFTFMNEYKTYENNYGADYSYSLHRIRININASAVRKAFSLIFETINAIQRNCMQETSKLAEEGKISREEFAILIESIECNSVLWREKIGHQLGLEVATHYSDFPSEWEDSNKPIQEGFISHTEKYRREWDVLYSANFILKNKDLFTKRCNELASQRVEST